MQWLNIMPRTQVSLTHICCRTYIVVMHLQRVDEDEKAVEHLLRMHKIKGDIADWLPGYKAELESVIGRRCREVFGDEYARVLKHCKVVKLRMNPEPKKNGRRKMRL